MSARHAVVAGGGIGGLAAAVGLRRRGWAVTVCERADSLEPVGSGLSLAPNALRALDVLGLGGAARDLAVIQGQGGIRRADGRWLVRTDTRVVAEAYGDPIVIALRAELVDLLVGALPDASVRTRTAVTRVDPASGVVETSRGELSADLVVAADGIHSDLRTALFPDHEGPRYAGATTWRFVVPAPSRGFEVGESWGSGEVFGIMPLSEGRVYCYSSAVAPAGQIHEDERAELLRRFGRWHDPIADLVRAASPGQILHNDVYHMPSPPPAYHRGRVALLGDAVHAMTPNLGQGACQAIEDAVVLAHLAERSDGLDRYTEMRRPRTTGIVRRSRRVARFAGMSFSPAVALRNAAMRASGRIGEGLLVRQMAPLASWTPPSSTMVGRR